MRRKDLKWCAQRDDFRTFLDDFVSSLPECHNTSTPHFVDSFGIDDRKGPGCQDGHA